MYTKVSDLDILHYLVRALPVVELLFIIQIIHYSNYPWLSFALCISLIAIGLILLKIMEKVPRLNLNLTWIVANIILIILCVVSGPKSPAWYFALSGAIASPLLAQGGKMKLISSISTIVTTCLGSWLAGRSLLEILPIFTVLSTFSILFFRTYLFLGRINETVEMQNIEIQDDRDEIDRLLSNILPNPIIQRLRSGESPIADQFESATVLFADIVGFTQWASGMNPLDLVTSLDRVFSEFDQLVSLYGLEKIKTIGDAYMVVGGVPDVDPHSMQRVVAMALTIQERMSTLSISPPLKLRIGIHAGPLVAGIIGHRKFAYDLWGDTVNIASRMESYGLPGKIHCSETIYEALKDTFRFEKRSPIEIRGKGVMQTYFLLGKAL